VRTRSVLLAAGIALALIGVAVWGTIWILRQPVPQTSDEVFSPAVGGEPDASAESLPTGAPAATGGEAPVSAAGAASALGGDGRRIQVKLYVLGPSGRELATETREIPLAASVQEQAKAVVELLLRRSSAIPSGVQLRELFITPQGVAYVDLSQELIANHPGGSSAEELTVYSLTQTLVANFPAIKTARILVEGREVQTLAGHLDLTLPYGRAPDYLQPPSERTETKNETS
jgi:Sporulation and spore germination